MDLIADTSFLVGLWRSQPWAVTYAKAHPSSALGLPWIVLGEFWHGALVAKHDPQIIQKFLSIGLPLLETEKVYPLYAKICCELQQDSTYKKIGQNDLWIAATALAFRKPLITKNSRHFKQIKDLELEVLVP